MRNETTKSTNSTSRLIRAVTIGAFTGTAMTLILSVLIVLVMVRTGTVLYDAMSALAITASCIGAWIGGFIGAKVHRSKGMLIGAACGGLIFVISLLSGLGFGGTVGLITLLRAGLTILCGAVGGVCGVNKRKRRR